METSHLPDSREPDTRHGALQVLLFLGEGGWLDVMLADVDHSVCQDPSLGV